MARPNNKFAKAGEADFVAGLCDALAPLGVVHARKMFGGWGSMRMGRSLDSWTRGCSNGSSRGVESVGVEAGLMAISLIR